MSRLPKTVYDVVVATVADRPRMKRLLEKGGLSCEQVALFTRTIAAVDDALLAVCDGEAPEVRNALLNDIARRRGYAHSEAKRIYSSKTTFDRRKREAVGLIAKMLWLV